MTFIKFSILSLICLLNGIILIPLIFNTNHKKPKDYESLEKFQEVIKSSHSIFDSNDNDISQPISDKIEKTLVENCKFVNMDK